MITHYNALYSGTATATGDTTLTPTNTRHDKEGIFYLDVTAASGVNPTLDIVFKVYDEFTDKWYELASFSRKVGISSDVGFIEYGLDDKVAVFYTIGGSNPSFTFAVTAHFKES
jgi:hypothetical protein